MKKILIGLLIGSVIYLSLINTNEKFIIPQEAIRLRVVPNSNLNKDQAIKNKVVKKLQFQMSDLLKDSPNIKDARTIISRNLNNIDREIGSFLKTENYNLPYNISFGNNYFPQKEYKGVVYEEGDYESLLVVLGDGLGDNWWCVLFPPLCLIEAEESAEAEYKFFIIELFKKYFE